MLESIDIRQSTLIKAMRFPLIVLVVFAHSLGFESVEITDELSGWNVYHFFSEMISHNFARIAVCWFYVFSGYLFFRYLKDGEFSFKWVLCKWKKRVRSLLIPYLVWNSVIIIATFIKSWTFIKLGFGDDGGMDYVRQMDIVNWFWSGPADFPLYFMRDLMLMSILAPLWYFVVKKCKWISLSLLILAYASPWNPGIPGMRAIFYFGVGTWMGICRYNMLVLCRRIKWPAGIIAVITLLIASYWNSSAYHEWLLRAFYPFGMITFMNICDRLIDDSKRCERLCGLAPAVFIIYATHEIYVLGWTKGLFLRMLGESLWGTWVRFLSVPIVVLCICLFVYYLMNRYMPKTLAFASGDRSKKQ